MLLPHPTPSVCWIPVKTARCQTILSALEASYRAGQARKLKSPEEANGGPFQNPEINHCLHKPPTLLLLPGTCLLQEETQRALRTPQQSSAQHSYHSICNLTSKVFLPTIQVQRFHADVGAQNEPPHSSLQTTNNLHPARSQHRPAGLNVPDAALDPSSQGACLEDEGPIAQAAPGPGTGPPHS